MTATLMFRRIRVQSLARLRIIPRTTEETSDKRSENGIPIRPLTMVSHSATMIAAGGLVSTETETEDACGTWTVCHRHHRAGCMTGTETDGREVEVRPGTGSGIEIERGTRTEKETVPETGPETGNGIATIGTAKEGTVCKIRIVDDRISTRGKSANHFHD